MDELLDGNLNDYLAPGNPLAGAMAVVDRVDKAKCLVHAVICTDAVDKAGDVVSPSGCLTDFHRLNPVVMYQHGLGMGGTDSPGYILPVGKAQDELGGYGVSVTPNEVTAWTKFSESTQFASQVFALYAEDILRGFSVNALPVAGAWRRIADKPIPGSKNPKPCFEFLQWQLAEYSATPVPVNQEALRISVLCGGSVDAWLDRERLTVAIQKGQINSEKFHKVLKSGLVPFMIQPKVQSHGVSLTKAVSMQDEDKGHEDDKVNVNEEIDRDEELEKPDPAGDEYEPEQDTETDTEGEGGDEGVDDSEVKKAEEFDADEDELMPSHRAALDGFQGARDYRTMLATKLRDIEHPGMRDTLADVLDRLHEVEEHFVDYLVTEGIKNPPKALATEELKAMCKKAKTMDASNPSDSTSILKGSVLEGKYTPTRFGILRAGVVQDNDPEVSPEEAEKLYAESRLILRRINRAKVNS